MKLLEVRTMCWTMRCKSIKLRGVVFILNCNNGQAKSIAMSHSKFCSVRV